jgi:3-phenylpropionate/trans-cinnamate dioxygenase ferredoxin reductase component
MGMHDTRAERLLVVGGGQAATQLIEVARQKGYQGRITLVTDEPVLPYQRPPLSKLYLTGLHEPPWLLYRPPRFYEKFSIETRLGRRAQEIDRARAIVRLDDGAELPYDKLALTTGTRSRRLTAPGADHPHVFYIRTLADAGGLRARLGATRRVVIVGAGFIGLETAAVLSQTGIEVTLLAAWDRLIPRIVDGEVASFLLDYHLARGVNVVLRATVVAFRDLGEGRVAVVLEDGRSYEADMALVGIGAVPNIELAEACGLLCDNGIVVDELARSSDPAIF